MKYMLVSLLFGEVQTYHQGLVEEIAEKFGVDFLHKQKVPTHFTLKDVFEAENIEELDKSLDSFVKQHKPARIYLEGYNRFEDNVIYMDIKLSEEARVIYEDLMELLKKFTWMQWSPYDDDKRVFHCSLAYFDIKDKYREICRYLLSSYKYSFNTYFEDISIFYSQDGDSWELYKSYKMTYDTSI
jgi:2'-5' RNA ligase